MDAKKTASQDPAFEELAKLGLDKTRDVAIAFTLTRKERFQMSGDDSIERIVFRIARPVHGVDSHEGVA